MAKHKLNEEQTGKLKNKRRVTMINKMLKENERKGGITMINKISLALMNKKEDLEGLHSQSFHLPDWRPSHRYDGTLTIEDHSLVFHGRDTKEKRSFAEIIPLNKITSISLGLDECSKGDSNLLLGTQEVKPLRIFYQSNGGSQSAYILTNFTRGNARSDDNQDWYETLRKYVNRKEEIIA